MSSEKEKKKLTPEEKALKAKTSLAEFIASKEGKVLLSKLKKIPLKPIKDPFKTLSAEAGRRLLTNTVLDEILGQGGISAKKIVLVYGEYGTGKTQLAWTLLVEAAEEGTVIYNDSEFSFCPERIEEIAKARGKDIEKIKKNLILVQPEDWMEHLAFPTKVPSPIDLDHAERPPLRLVIVDSLIAPFDKSKEFMGRQNLPLRSRMFRLFFADLRRIARLHDCPIFITNQVISVPDIINPKYTPMYKKQAGKGGPTVEHVPDIILYLRKSMSETRVARLMDSYELPIGERIYVINEKGIDDVPDETRKKIERVKQRRVKREEEEETEYESLSLD